MARGRPVAPDLGGEGGEDGRFRRVVRESLAPESERGREGGEVDPVRAREPPELQPPRALVSRPGGLPRAEIPQRLRGEGADEAP